MARIGAKELGAILTGKKPPVLEVNKVRRYQKRKKRRIFEASEPDWARWDAEAKLQGLKFSEFVRRALHGMCEVSEMRRQVFGQLRLPPQRPGFELVGYDESGEPVWTEQPT